MASSKIDTQYLSDSIITEVKRRQRINSVLLDILLFPLLIVMAVYAGIKTGLMKRDIKNGKIKRI